MTEVLSAGCKRTRGCKYGSPNSPSSKRFRSCIGDEKSQNYNHYVLDNIRNLINDEQINDVTFIVEDEELYGIRSLFACQSPVFRNMLYGAMMESNPSNQVILSDLSIAAFKYLRHTFYNIFNDQSTAHSTLTPDIVVDVLFAAQKYLIPPLITKCIEFMKQIESIDDWYHILSSFEASPFQHQSKLYLQQIINQDDAPYIFQYKSLKFLANNKFNHLSRDTIILLINSDYLAAQEHEIWTALIKWAKFNCYGSNIKPSSVYDDDDEEKEIEPMDDHKLEAKAGRVEVAGDIDDDNEDEMDLNEEEKKLMLPFIRYIRFNQMDGTYLKEKIVDKQILPASDIINIMFARENGAKWKSAYNDKERNKSKIMESFQISDYCLTLKQIKALKVGDLIDFRDFYGLFCPANVVEVDHEQNRIKIHYTHWGSTYDEWYDYLASKHNADDDENEDGNGNESEYEKVRLTQNEMSYRVAMYGSITNRNVKRRYFKKEIEKFLNRDLNDVDKERNNKNKVNEIEVKLPKWFWKKNENYIRQKSKFMDKWFNAKIVSYKKSNKYSHHLKIGVYVNDEHFEYWIHPDNDDEIRPFSY